MSITSQRVKRCIFDFQGDICLVTTAKSVAVNSRTVAKPPEPIAVYWRTLQDVWLTWSLINSLLQDP
jgi:hypothetical protein